MKEYFKILSNEIPEFLNDYINTPQMQKRLCSLNLLFNYCQPLLFLGFITFFIKKYDTPSFYGIIVTTK